jgi:hypothetical protein
MKPYKIIKPKNSYLKKIRIIGPLKLRKIPLAFFKNVHTPPKGEIEGY